jgi:hypothetical protein
MEYSLDLSDAFRPFSRSCEIKGEQLCSQTKKPFSELIGANFSRHLPYIFAVLEQVGKSGLTVVDGESWIQQHVIGDHLFINPKTNAVCKKAHFVAISALDKKSTYIFSLTKDESTPAVLHNLLTTVSSDKTKRGGAIERLLEEHLFLGAFRFHLLSSLCEAGGASSKRIDQLFGILGIKKKVICDKIEDMLLKKNTIDGFIELGKEVISNPDSTATQKEYAKYLLKCATELAPESAWAKVTLANALVQTHETSKFTYAEALYKLALKNDPNSLDAHEGLGLLYLHGGGRVAKDETKAKHHFQKLATLFFAQVTK